MHAQYAKKSCQLNNHPHKYFCRPFISQRSGTTLSSRLQVSCYSGGNPNCPTGRGGNPAKKTSGEPENWFVGIKNLAGNGMENQASMTHSIEKGERDAFQLPGSKGFDKYDFSILCAGTVNCIASMVLDKGSAVRSPYSELRPFLRCKREYV